MDNTETKTTDDSAKCMNVKISQSHSKKIVKHALRQQAKRRRKNTTIAAGTSAPLPSYPRVVVKSLAGPSSSKSKEAEVPAPETTHPKKPLTSKEVLASIPGFPIKQRKRTSKKVSFAEQLKQMREGYVDVETPDSILCAVDIKSLVNNNTFGMLPPLYQQKLVQLLPEVDRTSATILPDGTVQLSNSALNNEFFARACELWKERLAKGEFTPENQQRLKAEREKDRSRLDPWKLKNFEPIWGCKSEREPTPPRPPIKTTIKLRSTSSSSSKKPQTIRAIGAVTRAITSYRQKSKSKRPAANKKEAKTVKKLKLAETVVSDKPSTSECDDSAREEEILNITPTKEEKNIDVEVTVEVEEQEPVTEELIKPEVGTEVEEEVSTPVAAESAEEVVESAENEDFPEVEEDTVVNEDVVKEDEPAEENHELPVEENAPSVYPSCSGLQVVASSSEAEEAGPVKGEEETDDQEMKQEEKSEELKVDETVEEVSEEMNIIGSEITEEEFKSEMEDMNILEDDEENYILEENSLAEASEVMEALCIQTKAEGGDLLQVPEAGNCWDVDSTENLLNETETEETLRLDWRMETEKVESGELNTVQLFQDFSKLDIGVQLTEAVAKTESLVSSTVGTSQGFVEPPPVTTSSPPATIVCLPSMVSTVTPAPVPSTSSVQKIVTNPIPFIPVNPNPRPKTGGKEKGNRNSRSASNKPPPGAVNLERSYQICQAVIQSSPNRDQLKAQLKPPPSMLASAVSGAAAKRGESSKKATTSATQYSAVTSSKNGESASGKRESERLKKKGRPCYNYFDYF
ncbi:UNVERIFIED_CONTAM: hypothetical protein PYX00_006815 [Menopon gallinae]|uniref:DEUBAD domain-containing protein n=1 Tax=Menopon gallinae TaxID=328185 RepID=A0AAW2HXT5_9NEOP